MANVAQPLTSFKHRTGKKVREMAAMAQVSESHLSTWMRGASVSEKNVRKLMDAGLLTREEAAEALLGPEADVA